MLIIKEIFQMSIYILGDFIKACKVLGVEPTWERLHSWKKEMYRFNDYPVYKPLLLPAYH